MNNLYSSSLSQSNTVNGGLILASGIASYSAPILREIEQLISHLTANNFIQSSAALQHLYTLYGDDARLHSLKLLISGSGVLEAAIKDEIKLQLLTDEIAQFISSRPNQYSQLISRALETTVPSLTSTEDIIQCFSRLVKLPLSAALSIGLLLAQSLEASIREQGVVYLKSQLNQLNVVSALGPTAMQLSITHTLIHDLLFFVQTNSAFDQKQKNQLLSNLRKLAPQTCDQLTIQPLLANNLHSINSINVVPNNNVDYKEDVLNKSLMNAAKPARIMQDLGYNATENTEQLKEILQLCPELTEISVAAIVGMMCRTVNNLQLEDSQNNLTALLGENSDSDDKKNSKSSSAAATWNISVLVSVLRDLYPNLSWLRVFQSLDQPEFFISNQDSYELLLELASSVLSNAHFPVEVFFHEWNNIPGQLSFLQHAIPSKLQIFTSHQINSTSNRITSPIILGEKEINPDYHSWYSLDLLEILLELGEDSVYFEVKSLLKQAMDKCPELLLTGLITLKSNNERVSNSCIREELLSILLPTYLGFNSSNPANTTLINHLWESNSPLLSHWLIKLYLKDKNFISKINEVALQLRDGLNVLLESDKSFDFVVSFANQAAKQGQIKLEEFIQAKVNQHSTAFANSCMDFLIAQFHSYSHADRSIQNTLSIENLTAFLNVLIANKSLLSSEALNKLVSSYYAATFNNPQLLSLQSTVRTNLLNTNYLDSLDAEVSNYYQQFYAGLIPLDNLLDTINRCKNSIEARDRAIYSALIYVLFDEYRFYNNYPLQELKATAVLFGSLIQHKLFSSNFLCGLALKYVYEGLKQPGNSKLFQFSMWALETFRESLSELSQYSQLILTIPNIQAVQPQLVHYLTSLLQNLGINSQSMEEQIAASCGIAAAAVVPAAVKARSLFNSRSPAQPSPISIGGGSIGLFPSHPRELFNDLDDENESTYPANAPSVENNYSAFSSEGLAGGIGLGSLLNCFNSPLDLSIKNAQVRSATNGTDLNGAGNNNINSTNNQGNEEESHNNNNNNLTSNSHGGSISSTGSLNDGSSSPNIPPGLGGSKPPGLGLANDSSPSLTSSTPRKAPTGSTTPNPGQSFGSSLNIDSLLSADKPLPLAPSEGTKDKIHFIINNVSKANLRSKGRELKSVLKPEYYAYFARYLVIKRVSIEANFQKLYSSFLDAVGLAELKKQMIETTYDNIKVLLASDKVVSSSSERSLLKNLGSWLGLLTIAKNKPIRAKYLDLKQLILEAVDSGRLIAVIPFCAKILDSCVESKIFKPPNPWLMALIGLLREIFDLPGLKLNLKFEIEVLFNNLLISMKDVKPHKLLLAERSLSGDDSRKHLQQQANSNQQRLTGAKTKEEEANELLNQQNLGLNSNASVGATGEAMINNLPTYVTIAPMISLFNVYPHLKRCVPTSIDRAIREIISPVVERSVTIACVTTRELILKDFALEADENKIRAAAHQMVTNLTSSLALVTCKEPLRVSINNHLGSLLEANTQQSERQLVEQACLQVSSDNLELGCTLIEKAAAERAIREIDEALAHVYKQRVTARATNQPFVDLSMFAGKFPSTLPEPLRAKPTGLNQTQLRVYDDFSRIRQHYQAAAAAAPATESKPGGETKSTTSGTPPSSTPATPQLVGLPSAPQANANNQPLASLPAAANNSSGAAASSLTSQQTLEKLISYLAQLEQAVLRFPNHKSIPLHSVTAQTAQTAPGNPQANNNISQDHEIQILLRMLASLLNGSARDESSVPKEMIALTFAQKVFKRLYDRENRTSLLQIDVHTQVLKCIRAVCPKVVNELTHWLLYGDDDRKFIMPITAALLRARLLSSPDVDLFLSKLCINVQNSGQAVTTAVNPQAQQQPNAPATVHVLHPHLEFVFALIKRVVIKRPILQVVELSNTLDALTKLANSARHKILADTIQHLLEDVRTAALQADRDRERENEQRQQLSGTSTAPPAADITANPLANAQSLALAQAQAQAQAQALSAVQQQQQQQQVNLIPALENKPSHLIWDEDLDALDREIDEPEPTGLRQQVMYLLDDWMNICLQGTASDKTYGQYLAILHQQRVLSTNETTSRFFRIIIQLCIESALQSINVGTGETGSISYTAIDALAKLFVFLVKFLEPAPPANQPNASNPVASKIRLLNSFLTAAALVLRRDFEHSKASFNQRPYLRLFNNLLHDLNTPDPMLDSNNLEVLAAFGHCFRYLRPSRVPAFAFAWLELISHRMFMSKLLISKSINCSILMARLLVDLLKFLQPYLRNAELTDSIRLVYKGALRILLVLLHDFPEFLCEFHFSFCDYIPTQAIQMRNLILSAFPRNMRLPDPFTPNLKVDLLPEISQPPRIAADCTSAMIRANIKGDLDSYLTNRQPSSFLKQLQSSLVINYNGQLNAAEGTHQIKRAATQYNIPLINAIVLYVGSAGIANLQNHNKTGQQSQFQDNSCMDIFEYLIVNLDAECRYYLLNAIANQLRYPNNHTHYFSCVLLYLFLQCKDEVIMEQITRVLLERLIVHRPHPWGLLITFIELIKNPRYEFWRQAFTRQAPEIERLFESVARSCIPPSNANNQQPNLSNSQLPSQQQQDKGPSES
jgi:hypothetical protein